MPNQFRSPSVTWFLSLAVLLTTACRAPSPTQGDAGVGSQKESTADVVGVDDNSAESNASEESDIANDESSDEASKEETGIAELEEIVEAIAPEESKNAETEAVAEGVALALATEGLQIVDVETGIIRDIPFDVERSVAYDSVVKALGEPTETGEVGECPAGPITVTTWASGFSFNSADEKFIGWSVFPTQTEQALTTVAGVGIGTRLSDLKQAYEIEIFDSSLGVEFYTGQMSGLLEANEPDAMITNLWAGTNCIFR